MSISPSPSSVPHGPFERFVGRVRGGEPGPTLLLIGGMHGNEPGGVIATRRVIAALTEQKIPLRGEVVALAGNTRALNAGKRYLARDFNRLWSVERMKALDTGALPRESDPEAEEQRELRAVIDEVFASARGPVYFIDLHTTSAEGIPFGLVADTLKQRAFAAHFPLPVILGLEEQVDGVLVEWLSARGCVTLVCEGGQHDNPAAWDHLQAACWLGLEAAGLVERKDIPAFERWYARLDAARSELPRVMEVTLRHAIAPEDRFAMEPGFANIHPARKGQLLARDRRGEIRARHRGMVMMPLYQAQGADGFFYGREVEPWRMRLSHAMRRLDLDRALRWLPGVHPSSARDRLVVDTRVASLYPLEVFHLFGYRKIQQEGARLIVARRPGA
jgi:succinylglutamate desuccinylase